ncbi:hypothetical protein [Flammeovirga sp. SubArs3]|uniref:hypothetical protein n=1 Tax=Flammeovirga sp. SubArs3 TaxID=2995316 RepID=UPI00248CE7DB|nr:hypothetical protein [Flammeovirga sp. SubArs3]
MKSDILKVALRKNALVVPTQWKTRISGSHLHHTTTLLVANCTKLGFTFSEELLKEVNQCSQETLFEILDLLKEVTGVNKNWTPLVRQWDIPTGASIKDHIITLFAQLFQHQNGVILECGHHIPEHTFPLERYNGCPFCGTPFQFDQLDLLPSVNKLKVLKLWSMDQLKEYLADLLSSPVALDATQREDLKILINEFGVLPHTDIKIKETLMFVIDALVEEGKIEEGNTLFKSPNDILRYLWFKHTGFLQLVEPKVIVRRNKKNSNHLHSASGQSTLAEEKAKNKLKLKFTRKECRQYAFWLNSLSMDIQSQCELMHPKRNIWVRVIRALRLSEYSKRKGFSQLSLLMDTFYNEKYEVWQGKVDHFKMKSDAESTFQLLKKRPGIFARSLFSNMLWFGGDITIQHFEDIMDQVPLRLVFTLDMYAENYFDKNVSRSVNPLGGVNKMIPPNKLLQLYTHEELSNMQELVKDLSLKCMKKKFLAENNEHSTIYIEESLFNIPIAIGDRSETIQDISSGLMGTQYKVEGDTVRLFLQWGEGLSAQHLDMDLSCHVAYEGKSEFCSYSQLTIPGCQHSGDIQYIPEKVGTAEYIDVDLSRLEKLNAKYVTFTCNSYTNGSLSPNLVVGWMNSKHPMKISESGVAYDPTTVQHQVRVNQTLTKGLVFGVLAIETREIIWLEMIFQGQLIRNLNTEGVEALIKKLDAKLKIGQLLKLKSEVQSLTVVDNIEEADEVYDIDWSRNTAEVSRVFLGA